MMVELDKQDRMHKSMSPAWWILTLTAFS